MPEIFFHLDNLKLLLFAFSVVVFVTNRCWRLDSKRWIRAAAFALLTLSVMLPSKKDFIERMMIQQMKRATMQRIPG